MIFRVKFGSMSHPTELHGYISGWVYIRSVDFFLKILRNPWVYIRSSDVFSIIRRWICSASPDLWCYSCCIVIVSSWITFRSCIRNCGIIKCIFGGSDNVIALISYVNHDLMGIYPVFENFENVGNFMGIIYPRIYTHEALYPELPSQRLGTIHHIIGRGFPS